MTGKLAVRSFRRACVLVAVLLLLAPCAVAQADFSATITFGDSLTHNDLLGFPFKMDLYGADPMEAVFQKAHLGGDKLTNYAVAGSHTSHGLAQITVYGLQVLANSRPWATLISYELGGNDLLDEARTLGAGPPGQNPAGDQVIDRRLKDILEQLHLLYLFHPRAKFVIWTLPDVTYTPDKWDMRLTQAGTNFRAHLARLNNVIRSLEVLPQVVVLDTETLIRQLVQNPPVIRQRVLVGPPSRGGYDHLFADTIHPTAVANAILANVILVRMNARWNTQFVTYTESELAALARIP
ncbi:MAG: hypothetical protein JXQ29_09825 [Planctomycetes bacterium]|nr:hypothetical protein [Planctomycetota bacterium]